MEKSNNLLSKNKFLVSVAFIEKIVEKGRRFLDTREGNKRVAHVWKKEKKKKEKEKEKKRKKKSTRVLTKGRCSFCGDPRGGACIHANAGAFIPFAGRGS